MKSPLGLEAQLPVFELLKDAVFLLWSKRNRLLTMFLPLIIVLVVFDSYTSDLKLQVEAKFEVLRQAGINDVPEGFWHLLMTMSVSMLLTILLATTVHRFTLLEQNQWPKSALRLPAAYDMRYLWRTIQILLICVSATMFISIFASIFAQSAGFAPNDPLVLNLVMLICVPIVLYLLARFSVTLPELAIGTKGSDLARAWRMSSGNAGRLIFAVLILPIVIALPFMLLYASDSIVMKIVASFGVYFSTLISLSVLTLSYQFLIEFYEPQDGESVTPEQNRNDDDGMDA